MYLKLPEETSLKAIALLVKAIHPTFRYDVVHETLAELQHLTPVEDKTKELADLQKQVADLLVQAGIDKKKIKQLAKPKGT